MGRVKLLSHNGETRHHCHLLCCPKWYNPAARCCRLHSCGFGERKERKKTRNRLGKCPEMGYYLCTFQLWLIASSSLCHIFCTCIQMDGLMDANRTFQFMLRKCLQWFSMHLQLELPKEAMIKTKVLQMTSALSPTNAKTGCAKEHAGSAIASCLPANQLYNNRPVALTCLALFFKNKTFSKWSETAGPRAAPRMTYTLTGCSKSVRCLLKWAKKVTRRRRNGVFCHVCACGVSGRQ